MAWEDINTQAIDLKTLPGGTIEGIYLDKKDITTKIGPQVIWNFRDSEGELFGVYGFTNFNRSMERVAPGTLVRATYKGTSKVQTKFGLKDVHQVSVQAWRGEGAPEESSLATPAKSFDPDEVPF